MPSIASFSIEGLNNFFDYPEISSQSPLNELMILYGENGSGKTTVLNLIYHLLSAHPASGHLSFISTVSFKSLLVKLSDGTAVSAERPGNASQFPIIFRIRKVAKPLVEFRFVPDHLRDRLFHQQMAEKFLKIAPNVQGGKKKDIYLREVENYFTKNSDENSKNKYFAELKSIGITCYLIATDRRVKSDAIDDRQIQILASSKIDSAADDVISQIRALYLEEALTSAARYLNRKIIDATNLGSKNTNDIFLELIRKVSRSEGTENDEESRSWLSIEDAVYKINQLEKRNKNYAALGLTPELNFDSVMPLIKNSTGLAGVILGEILPPYIGSLDARQEALAPIVDAIQTFLNILNSLFKFKTLSFKPSEGFQIKNPNGSLLNATKLSSGEQQLLLMFCYLLVSNETQSIFMIDEPEISLNVKWQRELIDAMRKINRGGGGQIVIATHSIELLSQYSDMVVQLDPELSRSNINENHASKKNAS